MRLTIYPYLPLIPDLAILRDHGGRPQWFCRCLALGWRARESGGASSAYYYDKYHHRRLPLLLHRFFNNLQTSLPCGHRT